MIIKFRVKTLNGIWKYGSLETIGEILDTYGIVEETIGQYTEFDDINGVEIYQDDIVKIFANNKTRFATIKFTRLGFRVVDDDGNSYSLNDKLNIEVIGNIHDK